jgi:hypothetical protein
LDIGMGLDIGTVSNVKKSVRISLLILVP